MTGNLCFKNRFGRDELVGASRIKMTAEGMNMVYYKSDELMIRNMEEEDGPVFVEEFTAQGWHPDPAVYQRRGGKPSMLETERLILRRWEDTDAENLYEYAKDPDVGPIAGWPPHRDLNESRDVIRNVLSGKEAYAICLKSDCKAIGTVELKLNGHTDLTERDDECELGYWLGKPFWGQGIMPEAVREILRHAFEDLGMTRVWVGYYEGNAKSKRVQEKCGFRFQWRSEDVDVPLMNEKRTGYVSSITKEQWQQDRRRQT